MPTHTRVTVLRDTQVKVRVVGGWEQARWAEASVRHSRVRPHARTLRFPKNLRASFVRFLCRWWRSCSFLTTWNRMYRRCRQHCAASAPTSSPTMISSSWRSDPSRSTVPLALFSAGLAVVLLLTSQPAPPAPLAVSHIHAVLVARRPAHELVTRLRGFTFVALLEARRQARSLCATWERNGFPFWTPTLLLDCACVIVGCALPSTRY